MLGTYPQPPFLLHNTAYMNIDEHYESIRKIMSKVDNVNYDKWGTGTILYTMNVKQKYTIINNR